MTVDWAAILVAAPPRPPLIVSFLLCMWAMLIGAGGVFVLVLGQISLDLPGGWGPAASSAAKAAAALGIVAGWVWLLSRVRDWAFRRHALPRGAG